MLCSTGVNAAVEYQQDNPKRPGTKSHKLYEAYKQAKTLREMLKLGGRRADISCVFRAWTKQTMPPGAATTWRTAG